MSAEPVVVVCTTRSEAFAGVQRAFRPQRLAARTAASADELVALLGDQTVHLVLIDVHDRRLELDRILDVISGGGTSRFLPILILGGGERAERARRRLGSQIAVRTLDLEAVRDPQAAGEHAEFGKAALRRHARVPVRVRVRIGVEGVESGEGASQSSGQSHDLSEEGMGLVSTVSVPAGHRLALEFALPGDPEPVRLEAQVRRVAELSGGGSFLGVWFPRLASETRGRLRAFVERETGLASQDGPPPT